MYQDVLLYYQDVVFYILVCVILFSHQEIEIKILNRNSSTSLYIILKDLIFNCRIIR